MLNTCHSTHFTLSALEYGKVKVQKLLSLCSLALQFINQMYFVSFDCFQMSTNVRPILVRMEPSVPTLTEATGVLVTADLLERTVIKVREIRLVDTA